MPELGSQTTKNAERSRIDKVIRVVKTKQFRKIVACYLQAACAGWNGKLGSFEVITDIATLLTCLTRHISRCMRRCIAALH